MPQTRVRTATAVVITALMVCAVTGRVGADDSRLVVRIYETGARAPSTVEAAIRTAAAIVDEAGIAVDWRDCTDNGARPPCQNSHGARNLIVRIMPAQAGGASIRSASVEALNGGDSESPLGFAVIDPETRAGKMATIFHEQVRTVARRTGVEPSELLGRALAHEVGHLVLRAAGHSLTGLMRPVWTDGELILNRREDWVFAPSDRRRLQLGSADIDHLDLAALLTTPP